MNIYLHELRVKARSLAIWSVTIAAVLFVFMSTAPGFTASAELMAEMMSNFPKELLLAFGMESMDWSSILGFFALVFLFGQICLAIQAANYGFGLVSIEETELTADFLLAKPVSRVKIMTAKFLAAITALTITNLVVWGSTFLCLALFAKGQEFDTAALIALLLSIAVFQLFFLSVGMVISLMVRRVRSVIPFSMGLVFGLYLFNVFGSMLGEKSLELISPFKHFDPNYIIKNAAWDMPLVWISIIITLVSLAGSYLLYTRRNIRSAA